MDPKQFKQRWAPDEENQWTGFNKGELFNSPLQEKTKSFLSHGFPEDAAPFLSFGWESYDNVFYNLFDYYNDLNLNPSTKDYWIFGCDGGGNPICFDVAENDRIILLDHENEFVSIETINASISELAECILIYKEFVALILEKYGDDAFMEPKFGEEDVKALRSSFNEINPEILEESIFWRSSIEILSEEAKS